MIQSWRGPKSLAAAARQGNRGLLSTGYYIDLNQSAAEHYLADPLAGDGANLTPEEKKRVLGGEAAMWSEFTPPEIIDSRIWPRTAAIAERLWSAQDVRDVNSMYARMSVVSDKLEFVRSEAPVIYPAHAAAHEWPGRSEISCGARQARFNRQWDISARN